MRRVILTLLFVGAVAAPAAAQNTAASGAQLIVQSSAVRPVEPQASPDAMVARMLSFDSNHDGLVSRDELPERMQPLLARIEVFTTGDALDEKEIRRLAENPVAKPQVFVLQAGHYGFGEDEGFDTKLHIESALEDLRLASDVHQKALGIGRQFEEARRTEARRELLAAMTPLLSEEQMTTFVGALDGNGMVAIPASLLDSQPSGDTRARLDSMLATVRTGTAGSGGHLAARVSALTFNLPAEQNRLAQAALDQFTERDRFTDADRTSLLGQLDGLLSAQERDDLRAALERRPIVKRGGSTAVALEGSVVKVGVFTRPAAAGVR
jgi:hypothetical protein